MVLRELFVRLGLDKDETSFAAGFATVELLKAGLEAVSELAGEAKDFLKEQISATVEAGVETRRLAQSIGLGADEFQRWAYAAKVSEVSMETLRNATRELAQKGVKDIGGKILELADRFHAMADSGQKTALAVQYFGFRGTEMIPMLNKGSAALRAMMQEAGDLGEVMSGESLEATENFRDETHRLGAALDGLRNTVVLPMLGTLTRWVGALVEVVKAFRVWYATSERLAPVLKLILTTLVGLGVALAADAVATAVATVGWSGLAFAIGWAALEAWGATKAFIAASAPFALLLAGIALVVLAVQDWYTYLEGGDSLIGRAIHKWGARFNAFIDSLHGIFAPLGWIVKLWEWLFSGGLGIALAAGVEKIGIGIDKIKAIWKAIPAFFRGIWDAIKADATAVWSSLVAEFEKIPGARFLVEHLSSDSTPTAGAAIGGGAASPSAAAALGISAGRGGNRETHTTIAPVIHVHAAPGMSEGQLADHVADKVRRVARQEIRDHYDAVNRETAAATG